MATKKNYDNELTPTQKRAGLHISAADHKRFAKERREDAKLSSGKKDARLSRKKGSKRKRTLKR